MQIWIKEVLEEELDISEETIKELEEAGKEPLSEYVKHENLRKWKGKVEDIQSSTSHILTSYVKKRMV